MESKEPQKPALFAFRCDPEGKILHVQRDDLQFIPADFLGLSMVLLFPEQEQQEISTFLYKIQKFKAAHCDLRIKGHESQGEFYVLGGMVDGDILMVGSSIPIHAMASFYDELAHMNLVITDPVITLYEELMRVNNEYINQLRASRKEQSLAIQTTPMFDQALFIVSDMSRLNNELVAVQRDLARKNVELAIERERYRAISETISNFAYACRVDAEANLEYEWFAGALTAIIGYQENELVELGGLNQLVVEEDRPHMQAHLEKVLGGQTSEVEVRVSTRSGTICWLRIHNRPVWDEGENRVVRFYGAAQDITHQKQLQVALQEKNRLIDLGTLVAGMAHEINTPLQVITGTGDTLLNQVKNGNLPPTEILARKLERLHSSAWQIAEIIQALRAYAGTSEQTLQTYNLNELVQESLSLTSYLFEPYPSISLTCRLYDAPLLMDCMKNQVIRLLVHLITNARDAMRESGQVMITTHPTDDDLHRIFEIYNDGDTIPLEVQSQVFKPFFTTRTALGKKGLGLWIAARVVQLHGGEINFESDEKHGTTFRVKFRKRLSPELIQAMQLKTAGRFDDY